MIIFDITLFGITVLLARYSKPVKQRRLIQYVRMLDAHVWTTGRLMLTIDRQPTGGTTNGKQPD